ncbi:MAG: anhydro-N-acetylmuramic acid kinase [Pseudomonadota bacterium]
MRGYTALGMMSGTSLDGIDAAIVRTDGRGVLEPGPSLARDYDAQTRALLRAACEAALAGRDDDPIIAEAETRLTAAHADAARALIAEAGPVDLVGFHGQTILHRPDARRTWQIGDGAALARALGVQVVYDFRSADVAAGGEGAPFAPAYHCALSKNLETEGPVAVLNLGGVANLTFIPADRDEAGTVAFDTGPASGLVDLWMEEKTGAAMDRDGAAARAGRIDDAALTAMLDHPYFKRPAPKSLDRYDFSNAAVAGLSTEDGAAALTEFTARTIALGLDLMPERPVRIIACGGGRKNAFLMERIAACAGAPTAPAEAVGWRGDDVEAECFAYLAVRSVAGLPLSFPGTTGVPEPTSGGRLAKP